MYTMNTMKTTQKLALTGIIAAITLCFLFTASIIPNSKLFLYGVASVPIAIVIIECGYRYGILHYLATSYLAFVLLPNKYAVIPYIMVLGAYGIIKALAEKSPNPILEWVIKLAYFNIVLGLYLFLALKFLFTYITFGIPIWGLLLGSNALFIVYDIVYSFGVAFYEKNIRRKINIRR